MFLFAGLLPTVGALFLFAIGGYVVYNAWATDITGALPVLVVIGAGVPLVFLAQITNHSGFFREKPVVYTIVGGQLQAVPVAPTG